MLDDYQQRVVGGGGADTKKSRLIKWASDNSIDIKLETFDGSDLSPTSKGVYKQWIKDSKDDLLVDGYFRKAVGADGFILVPGVNSIITSYYLKSYSKRSLYHKNKVRAANAKMNKEHSRKVSLVYAAATGATLLFIARDIAMMAIHAQNECSVGADNHPFSFGLNTWIWTASIAHMFSIMGAVLIVLGFDISRVDDDDCFVTAFLAVLLSFVLFLLSWSVVGLLFQAGINDEVCSNAVLAWIVLQFIEGALLWCCLGLLLFVWKSL